MEPSVPSFPYMFRRVRAEGRAEAIELAKRFPHAKWGPVEVREILFFDRV